MTERKYKTTTEAALRAALSQGLSIAEAAQFLGTSPRMTYHTCSVLGIKSGSKGGRGKRTIKPCANNPFRLLPMPTV